MPSGLAPAFFGVKPEIELFDSIAPDPNGVVDNCAGGTATFCDQANHNHERLRV